MILGSFYIVDYISSAVEALHFVIFVCLFVYLSVTCLSLT